MGRMLAAMLGLYLAFGMSRAAAGLIAASAQASALQSRYDALEAELQALRQAMHRSDEEVRQWALRQGLVAPGDIVFLDGG